MRPDALEMLQGVQRFLQEVVLPEMPSVYLQSQVGAAIGLLHTARIELAQGPQAWLDGAVVLLAVCTEAVPLLSCTAGDTAEEVALLRDLATALAQPEPAPGDLAALRERYAGLRGLVGRIAAYGDVQQAEAPAGEQGAHPGIAELRHHAYAALRSETVRQLRLASAARNQ